MLPPVSTTTRGMGMLDTAFLVAHSISSDKLCDSCSMPPAGGSSSGCKEEKEQYNCQSANPVVELKQNDRQKQYNIRHIFASADLQDPSLKMLFHDIPYPPFVMRNLFLYLFAGEEIDPQCPAVSENQSVYKDQQKLTKNGGYASCLQEIINTDMPITENTKDASR